MTDRRSRIGSRRANRSTSIFETRRLNQWPAILYRIQKRFLQLSAFTYHYVYGCRLGSLNAGRKFKPSFDRKSQGQVSNH